MARYYVCDPPGKAPVSAEITGYAVSALTFLHSIGGREEYREAALRAARFLTRGAWDPAASTFPFEPGSKLAYFFDLGIIVRGLLAAWRATGDAEFHDRAREAALSLAFDFLGGGGVFHPVISLPDKQPLPHEPRWSRSPGCYQLKAALAWRETGEEHAGKLYEAVLAQALASHRAFLASETDREKTMDRLHAYCYFLEGLLPVADRPAVRTELAWGVSATGRLLREIAPLFERSDVCAQLLRVRLIAHHLGALPLEEAAAREEAGRARSFQAADGPDERIRGGFYFGRKNGRMLPFSNPVSTAFCLQALHLWERHESGSWAFDLHALI